MERDQASKFVNDLLRLMVSRNGSDLFLTADFPPAIKVDGKVTKVSPQPLTGQHTLALTRAVMNDKQAAEFERTKESNFAISPQGIGRFRVNAFVQQGNVGLVLRTIPKTLPTIDAMNLPHVLKDVALTKRGLVIFVGATGSGKSTSLAAIVDHRNENSFGHIITIEDPVEFVHPHKNCIITQREVGIDTEGWEQALRDQALQVERKVHQQLRAALFREEVDDPVERLVGAVGVQRGQAQVAGLGERDGVFHGLAVADFAHQNDIGRLTQRVL